MTSTSIINPTTIKTFTFDKSIPVFPKRNKSSYRFVTLLAAVYAVLAVWLIMYAVHNAITIHSGLVGLGIIVLGFALHILYLCDRITDKDRAKQRIEREKYYLDQVVKPVLTYLHSFGYQGYPTRNGDFSKFDAGDILYSLHSAYGSTDKESYYGLRIYDTETGKSTDSFFKYSIKFINRNTITVTTNITDE
jgi:hypothetical protein